MDTNQRLVTATQSTLINLSSEPKEGKRVFLKVQRGPKKADEFYYWMCRNTLFRVLMIDYIERIGVPLNSVAFVFDGSAINPSFSPESLKLEDGGSIDVTQRDKYTGTEKTLICLPRAKGEMPITLILVDSFKNNRQLHYLIGRNARLKNLFLDYTDRTSRFYEDIRLCVHRNGLQFPLDPKETVDDLKMKDGDIIVEIKTTNIIPPRRKKGKVILRRSSKSS